MNIAEKLLNREILKFDTTKTHEMLKGKTVIVTGGGGSIGSELCAQIYKAQPATLVILDFNENSSYMLYHKLGMADNVKLEIASIREREKIFSIFEKYKPNYVFHTAAHKHVPLMELSPDEAVKNNIFGTLNVMDACSEYGALKMVLISTDKVVNPTSVMGATKRFCEMMVQSRQDSKTIFSAVRFGNVLGSNGSVVPIFQDQIKNGGPITITDKNITRFFMTVSEAVGLILKATVIAKPCEVYVLNMGNSVSILNLAENLIKLNGLVPYKDIDIVETGIREGEKMYEELLINPSSATKTENDTIIVDGNQYFSKEEIDKNILLLKESLKTKNNDIIIQTLKKVID